MIRGGVENTRLEDKKNPRPRTAFPRTDPLEAKDRNAEAKDQEHSRKYFPKNTFQKSFSSNLQFIGKDFRLGRPKAQITCHVVIKNLPVGT